MNTKQLFMHISSKMAGFLLATSIGCLLFSCSNTAEPTPDTDVIMQAFYWDVPVDAANQNGNWWNHLAQVAPELHDAGITAIWTPVPAKGNWGIYDSGYGIYDHYDLGNYSQKGTVETRYGSRAELEQMIATMHQNGIYVYSDVVLNHLYGGDENFEANPAVTDYAKHNYKYEPYPDDEIRWSDDSVAHTRTNIFYPTHANEPNYEWHYNHFHPSSAADSLTDFADDVLRPNTKFFGNDLNLNNEEVCQRLCEWGKWLKSDIGFDGFRMDFVRGLTTEFVAKWVNNLPKQEGKQPFVVGEYWAQDSRYIKDWVETVASLGANVHAFDFPLKFTLTDMCNKSGAEFNMAWLNHAGLVRNQYGASLPSNSVVTFVENHDTGKEYDKWITHDMHLAYAYILTHEGTPCIFYPHFFGDIMTDAQDNEYTIIPPTNLGEIIAQLINIRKTYLGGNLVVLSEQPSAEPKENLQNVYIARRQGNGVKDGAIVVINNDDYEAKSLTVNVNADGFTNWAKQTLVNLIDTAETITVDANGQVELSAPARNYSIWVKQQDLK